MRDRAKTALAFLSLLIFVLSVTLWVRSYVVADFFFHRSTHPDATHNPPIVRVRHYELDWSSGVLCIERYREEAPSADLSGQGWFHERRKPRYDFHQPDSPDNGLNIRFAGLQLVHRVTSYGDGWFSDWRMVLPFWSLLPTAIPPAIWYLRRRRTCGRVFPVMDPNTGGGGV